MTEAATTTIPSPRSAERLPWSVVLGYSAGQFGTGILPLVLLTWMMYFYSPPEAGAFVLLSPAVLGTIRLVERIAGAVFEPLIGHLSDRSRSRYGRRLPWIVLGLPFLVGSFVLIWFPPAATTTDDPAVIAHCAIVLMVFFASYTAVVAPFGALLPEIAASARERLRLSVWMSIFEVLSNIVGAFGAGAIVGLGAIAIAGVSFANGYELLGIAAGLLGLLSFLPVPLLVREPPRGAEHDVPFSLVEAMKHSLKNPAFIPYALGVGGFRFATTSAIVGLPYIATQLMGTSEEGAGAMQGIIIIVAALAFPLVQALANRHGTARVFRWAGLGFVVVLPMMGLIGHVPHLPPMAHGIVIFVLAGFSTAGVLVLPRALMADVIDLDAKRTGYRREAMYNGMGGVVEKLGEAFGMGAVGYLFQFLGQDAERSLGLRLVGVAAAIGVGLGLVAFRSYRIDHEVTS